MTKEEVVRRFREAKAHGYSKFGNDIFSVKFPAHYQDPPSIFNAVYNYQLEEQVNIEEFLVYFPVLEDICRQHGLKCEIFEINVYLLKSFLL